MITAEEHHDDAVAFSCELQCVIVLLGVDLLPEILAFFIYHVK